MFLSRKAAYQVRRMNQVNCVGKLTLTFTFHRTVSMVVANERRSRGGLDEPIKPVVNEYGKIR